MRKHQLSIGFFLAVFCVSACGNKENKNTETSINARADSVVGARLEEINHQAMDDLEKRMTIEVKAKADSIVAARTHKGTSEVKKTTDTVIQKQRGIFHSQAIRAHDSLR